MSRALAASIAVAVVTLGLVPAPRAGAALAGDAPVYLPPVRPPMGVVTDRFWPPPNPYAAGNRGLDYATVPGATIVASAAGVVVFAGQVGGALHVTVAHPDGLRTSYSFLARLLVTSGQAVEAGQPVGRAGAIFHFGVRDAAGHYLDPEQLFAGRVGAHLVPGPDDGAPPLGSDADRERRSLLEVVRGVLGRTGGGVAAFAEEELSVLPSVSAYRLAHELTAFAGSQRRCTPAAQRVPAPRGRRIVVLVGGLGSTASSAAVDQVDTMRLGYDPADVLRFSYTGGRVARRGSGPWPGVAVRGYDRRDTEVDLRTAGAELVDLLDQVTRLAPGVPVDVIAHSEGGVVARLAIDRALAEGRLPARLGVVVTIATPHQGADAATALQADRANPGARLAMLAVSGRVAPGLDLEGSSLAQLSQVSGVTAELSKPVPPGVRLVSIGASGDLTVPWVRTVTPGAASVLVDLAGPSAHDRLPGAAATTRAIALALAGRPPPCLGLAAGVRGVVTSHLVAEDEDAFGLTMALGAMP